MRKDSGFRGSIVGNGGSCNCSGICCIDNRKAYRVIVAGAIASVKVAVIAALAGGQELGLGLS